MKKVIYAVLSLLALYLILTLFGPSEIKVERQIKISRSKSLIQKRLCDFYYFHDKWSPWTEKDPAMITSFKGNAGEAGHLYTWSGNKEVNEGEMELLAIKEDSVLLRINFDKRQDSKLYFILKESDAETEVTWGLLMDIGFFGRAPMLFINMDKMIGPDFEKGLSNLKGYLEAEPATSIDYTIKELQWEASTYIGRKESVSFDEMDQYFETHFGLLSLVLEKEKIEPLSAPSGLYFSYDGVNQRTDLSCAYKVPNGIKVKGWESFEFPASKVLCIEYKGDPSNSGEAHKAMDSYIREHGLEYKMVIEEYLTDPKTEVDKAEWMTKIYYLLK